MQADSKIARSWSAVRLWSDMIKLSHSVFALPFAVMAAFLAGRQIEPAGRPMLLQLSLIAVCMVAGRSVAMTFNRIVDAGIDARNPRTAGRPIPAGQLSKRAAWFFLAGAAILFVAACTAFWFFLGNPWPVLLSGPVLVFLCFYSLTKRFTRWAHFYLGAAIALSPPAAWIAVHPASLGWSAAFLSAAVALWIAGFDIIYACQDTDADRRERLYSLPATIGPARALWVARGCHVAVVVLLIMVGNRVGLGALFFTGVLATAVLLLVENLMVRHDDLSRVNIAFFTINGLVSILLGTLTVCDVIWAAR